MMKRIIVGRRRLEIGQSVSNGQDLIDIVPLADVWITAKSRRPSLPVSGRASRSKSRLMPLGALGRTVWANHGPP